MAGEEVAAKRYAQAAFDIATERNAFDSWRRGLRLMADVLGQPELAVVLQSTRVPAMEKARLLDRALAELDPVVRNLAKLLAEKGRISLAPLIAEAFERMDDERRGIAHAQVRTAVPLSDAEQEALARRLAELTGRQVTVEAEVDPSLIGGLVARIGDQIIDGSTRTKLLQLRRRLEAAAR